MGSKAEHKAYAHPAGSGFTSISRNRRKRISQPCTRNWFDRAKIARVMNAAGRRRDALPQVKLYAEYDQKMLLPFLRSSQHYMLENL
nr:hypothetical protein [Tanacetum cinerariifolium]